MNGAMLLVAVQLLTGGMKMKVEPEINTFSACHRFKNEKPKVGKIF